MRRTRSSKLPDPRRTSSLRSASSSASAYSLPARKAVRTHSSSSVTPSASSSSSHIPSRRSINGPGASLFHLGLVFSLADGLKVYKISPDERDEDHELAALLGETEPAAEEEEDKPVRLLDDFSLYEYHSLRMCPIPGDYDIEYYRDRFGGSGTAECVSVNEDYDLDTDSDGDKEEKIKIKLGQIQELWFDVDGEE